MIAGNRFQAGLTVKRTFNFVQTTENQENYENKFNAGIFIEKGNLHLYSFARKPLFIHYIYILIESNDCVANRIDEYKSMVNLAVHWFIKTIKVAFSINNVINKSQWF